MKTKLFFPFSLMVLIAFGGCSFRPSIPANEFLLQGTLTQVPDSTVIELRIEEGQLYKLLAKDILVQGKFEFRDTITAGPKRLRLSSSAKGFPGSGLSVWVAPGKDVQIKGTGKLLKTWEVESDIPEQAVENRFTQATCPELIELLKYEAHENDLFHEVFVEHAGDEAFARVGWAQIDSLRELEKPLQNSIHKKEIELLKKEPVSTVWMQKLYSHSTRLQWDKSYPYIPDIKELYTRMSAQDKQTEIGQAITEYMNLGEEVQVGDKMADGDLYDLDGQLHHLSELKGSYILLDFWSRGCAPCLQSIPEVEELSELYKGKLVVVSINGDPEKGWKQFVQDKKMTGIQWNELRRGRTGLAARYKAIGIPHYVLITPDGIIKSMWSGYGPGSLKAKLKELVK